MRGFCLSSGEGTKLKKGDEMIYNKTGGTLGFSRRTSRIFFINEGSRDDKLYVGKEFSDNTIKIGWLVAAMIEADIQIVSDNSEHLVMKFV